MFGKAIVRGLLRNIVLFVALTAYTLPAQAVDIEFVTVRDAGNSADTRTGYGAVSHAYQIGKYEVTVGQYTQFLNSVAKDDTYGLYNETKMGNDSDNGGYKIERSGFDGNYSYSATLNPSKPVNWVSFWDACRFTNWLSNGQLSGAQNALTTERGAYTLDGYTGTDGHAISHSSTAKYYIPTADEWYKAAYYKGGSSNAGYWPYPTKSNTVPNGGPPPGGSNSANLSNLYTTTVGAYTNSPGPHGTYDQAGNVWEWTESLINSPKREERGGCWGGGHETDCQSTYQRGGDYPTFEGNGLGFRVACEVPEPSTFLLLGIGAISLLSHAACRRRS